MVLFEKNVHSSRLEVLVKGRFLRPLGGIPLTAMDHLTGDGPFCYGRITGDNGLSPRRTVRRCE